MRLLRRSFHVSRCPLDLYLAAPLRPMNLHKMDGSDRTYVRTALEQLGARTARCYRAISSELLRRNLDRETNRRLVSLEAICKREFENCVDINEAAETYLGYLERGEICETSTAAPNEISDDAHVDSIMKGGGSFPVDDPHASGKRLIEVLENLRPHDNIFDIIVNEECISSPYFNNWLSRFCRRRVSWRVIHEHLLHLVGPRRYSPIVRKDRSVGDILQHTGTVVIEQYTRNIQRDRGGSMKISVEEQPNLFSQVPEGQMVTSSNIDNLQSSSGSIASGSPSEMIYSIEGHLEYVFRELMKNACMSSLSRTTLIELHVKFGSNDTHVIVDVTDTAGGLSAEAVRNLWLFGWTTSPSPGHPMGGFGIGLPASKVYMDLWGGRIDLYSRDGAGSTARVTFPKAPIEVLVPKQTCTSCM